MKIIAQYAVGILVVFIFGAWTGHEWGESSALGVTESRVHSYLLNGQLTNPLLECTEGVEEISVGDRAKIEESVRAYVESAKKQGMVTDAAVYFRDLNNGPWFGIDERKSYTPGSLLKLPIAMSYYWRAQRERDLLNQQIDYEGSDVQLAIENSFSSDVPLPAGVYSIQDLIERMLRESNNEAAQILAEYAGIEEVQRIYKDFGIEPPNSGSDYEINAKTFGAFFRVLYNASYVGQPSSEAILATLTQSTFRDGLVAGVPAGTKVAHKFGTRVVDGSGGRQLHDCGIVYAPKAPYVLCVMTRGNSSKNLSYFIAQVSKRVYEGVTR